MSAASGGWSAASASVRGASHERSGKPNQDAVRVVTVAGETPGVVATVCDGHGGDRYVRSDVGSRLAAEEASTVGRRALASLGPNAPTSSIDNHLKTVVAPAIVERWSKRVLLDVEQRPFTDDERQRAGDPLDRDPLISYGCTLVLGLFTATWIAFLQIGDGDVTIVSGSTAGAPVPGDDRLVGGETTSLCLPTAVDDARTVVLGAPLPDLVLLTSDGYANSFASPTWREEVGFDLLRHVERLGIDGVEEQLASWLGESAIAAGDDVSMALIHRSTTDHRPAAATAAAPVATPAAAGAAPRRGRGRIGAVVGAVAVAALVGGLAGWFLADDGDASVAVVATTGPSSTAPVITVAEPTDSERVGPSTTMKTSTVTTTVAPVQTGSSEIGAQDLVALFIGEVEADDGATQRIGVILAFDPTSPSAPGARSFGWVRVSDKSTTLPEGWNQGLGLLSFEDELRGTALAVLRAGDYVWAVDGDGVTLVAYEVASGDPVGRTSIDRAGDPAFATSGSLTSPSSQTSDTQPSITDTTESAQE